MERGSGKGPGHPTPNSANRDIITEFWASRVEGGSVQRPKIAGRKSTYFCFHLVQKRVVGRLVSAPWVSDSLAGRNWALLPKINVPSPAPWLPAPAH